MSSVSISQENPISVNPLQCDSLLEHLYTYFGVDELKEILTSRPDDVTLKTWNVSVEEFKSNVQSAIEFIARD